MAEGVSIHIGLNRVDPNQYEGWDGQLAACVADANDMFALAKKAGFEASSPLLNEHATAGAVTAALRHAAKTLAKGDLLLLTYSGHGGQVKDTNGDEAGDNMDETWVLFDRQLVDDELFDLWSKFHEGTRIFVLSDSCHSGTVARGFYNEELIQQIIERYNDMDLDEPRVRSVPEELRTPIYEDSRDTYDAIQQSVPPGDKAEVDAQVILISGCQDNQESLDGSRNGLFTAKLLETWKQGGFRGYRSFARKIKSKLPPTQSPNYFKTGHVKPEFEREQPLTIADREQTAA
jgi:hypothetical protein